MTVEIRVTNNRELEQQKRELVAALRNSTQMSDAGIEDFRRLAHSGMLDQTERGIYDELSITMMLLGEELAECA